jgi:hypothetical protein
MATTVNWLLIFLGIGIGIVVGIAFEKFRIWQHRTRAGLRLAMPAIKMAAVGIGVMLGLMGFGLLWLGVI